MQIYFFNTNFYKHLNETRDLNYNNKITTIYKHKDGMKRNILTF